MIKLFNQVSIVIDALDECTTLDDVGSTRGLLSWIKDIATNYSNVHLLVTSQLRDEVTSQLRNWATVEHMISIESGSADDIQAYIRTRLRGSDFVRWEGSKRDLRPLIEKRLVREANGM